MNGGNGFARTLREEFGGVDSAQSEEERGIGIKNHADPVKGGGDVLAHVRPIGAGAGHPNLFGCGEEAARGVADQLENTGAEPASEEIQKAADLARTGFANRHPVRLREGLDVDLDLVEGGAGDLR